MEPSQKNQLVFLNRSYLPTNGKSSIINSKKCKETHNNYHLSQNVNQDFIQLIHQSKYQNTLNQLSGSICLDNLFKKQSIPYRQSIANCSNNKNYQNGQQYQLLTKNNRQNQYNSYSNTQPKYFLLNKTKANLKKEIQSNNPQKAKSSNFLLEKVRKSQSIKATVQSKYHNSSLVPKFNIINNFRPFQGFVYQKNKKQSLKNDEKIRLFAPFDPFSLKIDVKKVNPLQKLPSIQYFQNITKSRPNQTKTESDTTQSITNTQNNINLFQNKNKHSNKRYFFDQKEKQFLANLSIKKNNSLIQKKNCFVKQKGKLKINKLNERNAYVPFFAFNNEQCDFNEQTISFFTTEKVQINQTINNLYNQKITSQYSNAFQIIYSSQNELIKINNLLKMSNQIKVQVASITKIMTCLLALKIAQFFNIQLKQQKVFTTQKASKMHGTSASLLYSDMGTLQDFLHGLMLPSGNDAAIAIAQWGGKTIKKYFMLAEKHKRKMKSTNQKQIQKQKLSNQNANNLIKNRSNIKLFIYHMNKGCRSLSLDNTYFANPHGLINSKSYSTAYDICQLAHIAMKNNLFRQIVFKSTYTCKLFNRTYSGNRQIKWKNTNKLIGIPGFQGIKTGITSAAGPCLVSQFRISKQEEIIICVLKSKNMLMRFVDTLTILKSIIQQKLISFNDLNRSLSENQLKRIKSYKNILNRLQKVSQKDLSFQGQDEHANDFNQEDPQQSDNQINQDSQQSY